MLITISEPSLLLLIGPSGSGKSTFAHRYFRNTEILSSDFCRALVSDDESNQAATDDAFELLHLILKKRLQRRRTTVIDATNVQLSARQPLLTAAFDSQMPIIAILFALPEEVCLLRNRQRASRQVSEHVIKQQFANLNATLPDFGSEGFQAVFTLSSANEAETVKLLRNDRYS